MFRAVAPRRSLADALPTPPLRPRVNAGEPPPLPDLSISSSLMQ
jgi:hypothetical protein